MIGAVRPGPKALLFRRGGFDGGADVYPGMGFLRPPPDRGVSPLEQGTPPQFSSGNARAKQADRQADRAVHFLLQHSEKMGRRDNWSCLLATIGYSCHRFTSSETCRHLRRIYW